MDVMDTMVEVLLVAAGALVLLRIGRGPSMLDRSVALDVLMIVVVVGIAAQAAGDRTGYFLPVLLVVSFLGFTGSVSIARFIAFHDSDPDDDTGATSGGERPPERRADESSGGREG